MKVLIKDKGLYGFVRPMAVTKSAEMPAKF